MAGAGPDDAAQLDRAIGRRRGHVHDRGDGRGDHDLHDAAGHAVGCDVLRVRGRASRGPASRRAGRQVGSGRAAGPIRRADIARRSGGRRHARGRVPRRACDQPRQPGADPVLRGAVRADGVRDRRDHGRAGARPARLRVRETARHRGPGRRAARGRRAAQRGHDDRGVRRRGRDGRERTVRRSIDPRLDRRGDRVARDPGPREARGQLPATRLVDQSPAVLGPADPDRALPDVRGGRGAGRRAAGAAAGGRGLPTRGRKSLGPPPDVEARLVPVVWRRGAARHRHIGHVRRFELVLLPVLLARLRGRTVPARGRRPVDAGRPVHRRGRARDPAPALLAVRHQGALRPGDGRIHRAIPAPDEPGPGDLRRRLDVEVEGQHRRADAARGAVGCRHDAAHDAVRRPVRGRHRLEADRAGPRQAPGCAPVARTRVRGGERRGRDER